jgi:uncharacterized protein YjaZ
LIALGDYESAIRFQPNASALTPPCPPSVLQFGLDRVDDHAWTQSNRPQWSTEALFDVVEAALRRSHAALPGLAPDVCVGLAARPGDPVLQRMAGIGGATVAPDVVALFVAPSLNPILLDVLPFTIAHEYHHAVHWESWPTGLDVLIREGQAHHFAWTLYPELLHPSASALAGDQIGSAWRAMRPHLGEPSRQFIPAYMFGGAHNGNRVPGWAGYTIGFCLVWDYASRHPGLTPEEIARIPAREFLAKVPRCPERQPGDEV